MVLFEECRQTFFYTWLLIFFLLYWKKESFFIPVHLEDKAMTQFIVPGHYLTDAYSFKDKNTKRYDRPTCLPLQYACTEIEAFLVFTYSLRAINVLKRPWMCRAALSKTSARRISNMAIWPALRNTFVLPSYHVKQYVKHIVWISSQINLNIIKSITSVSMICSQEYWRARISLRTVWS